MDSLSLADIAGMCGATQVSGQSRTTVRRISKDTRTLVPGDLYFALKGESFDGNAFAADASARGAAAAVLDDPAAAAALPRDFPYILVADASVALHRLASSWRDRLAARVVCITGSNGKTSTKDFTAGVLGIKFRTIKTQGNLNNHIGLPLSILSASMADGAAIWEIGMNHPGEITPLAQLARPDIGIVTNIGVAHIEHMGSRQGIAQEKACLLEALSPSGTAIFPACDDFADYLATRTKAQCERVGGPASSIRAENIEILPAGTRFTLIAAGESLPAEISVPGTHMVTNALLAVAAGLACGLTPAECVEGLAATRVAGGRLTRREIRGIHILDDTYNANPDSMVAALDTLAKLPGVGRRIAILGRMGELGQHADEGYRRVGTAAATQADIVIAVGPETAPLAEAAKTAGIATVHACDSTCEAAKILRSLAVPGDNVLVKGSRAARMEGVIQNF